MLPASLLRLGIECGHSDATSGLGANPLAGMVADRLMDAGGVVVFGETMEWLGAEHTLAARAATPEVGAAILAAVARREARAAASGEDLTGIGLCALPVAGARLRVETVLEADALCFLRSDHPLARLSVVTPADLASEPLILGVEAAVLCRRLDDAFRQAGASQHILATTDSTPLIAALVREGAGIAVSHALPSFALPQGVVTRPLRPAIPFTYVIPIQPGESQAVTTRSFCGALHDAAAFWATTPGQRRADEERMRHGKA